MFFIDPAFLLGEQMTNSKLTLVLLLISVHQFIICNIHLFPFEKTEYFTLSRL